MPSVYIVGGGRDFEVMFLKESWTIARHPDEADYLQFTGGSDVDPMLYFQPKHATTACDPSRDSRESHIFWTYEGHKKMLGVCRGGQFLNVMSGGSMWQHVDNHGLIGTHKAMDVDSREWYDVTSTHHQMMDPSDEAEILVRAGLTTYKDDGFKRHHQKQDDELRDIEAVFYPEFDAMCYQPHPEYTDKDHPCHILYFKLIERYMF